ncbi:MAG: hypothetical protein JNL94_08965 [Planctomycetes bacterium]|nr:hypothetical protein [Planctomycetota bacterium]
MKESGSTVVRTKRGAATRDRPPWIARVLITAARRVAPPSRAFGIEPDKLVALLELRFALDARATRSLAEGRTGVSLGQMLIGALFIALFTTIVVVTVPTAALAVGVVSTALWLAIPTMLLGAWLDVLLDGASESVIAPTPVGDRTVLAARLLFLATYATATVGAIVALPLAAGVLRHGLWPFLPIGLVATATSSVTAVLLLLLAFLVLARVVPGDRFRVWALRAQFATAIAFPLAWQIVPRLLPHLGESVPHWVLLAVPPCWPAGLASWCDGEVVPLRGLRTALTFVVPLASFACALALANRRFVAATASPQTESHRPAPFAAGPIARFCARVGSDPDERAGFEFARVVTLRERSYVVHTMPGTILALVLFGASVFAMDRDMVSTPHWVLFGLLPLLLTITLPTAIWTTRATESPEAAWLRDVAPYADDRALRSGSFKLLLVRWCAIPSLCALAVCSVLGSWRGALFSAVSTLAAFHLDVLACTLLDVRHPFRAPYSTDRLNNAAPSLLFFLHTLLVLAAGAGLLVAHDAPIVLAVGGVALSALAPLRWRALRS